jgi:hypothetical protein
VVAVVVPVLLDQELRQIMEAMDPQVLLLDLQILVWEHLDQHQDVGLLVVAADN